MPTSTPRQCNRCGRVVPSGERCACSPAWSQRSTASARRNGSTRRSRRQRAAMLADQPMCARRGNEWWWPGPRVPCSELATIDDHVQALALGGDPHDPANRQGLCADCHEVKTKAEARVRSRSAER